jgi:integrase
MARRSKDTGSVFYDKARGCWVGVLDVGTDPDTGRRIRRKVSAPTKTKQKDGTPGATEKLATLAAELAQTGTVSSRTVTVEHVVRDWLANLPAEITDPTSVRLVNSHGEKIIKAMGGVRLHDLRASRVEAFLRAMAADRYSTSVISATKGVLVRSIRRAQRDGLAGQNVADLVDCPAGKRRTSKAMEVAEVRALLAAAAAVEPREGRHEDWTPVFWTAYCTTAVECGMRPGELTGLTWDDIDFEAGTITVTHSLKRVNGKLALADLKTDWSGRTVVMPKRTRAVLQALRKEQAADKLLLGQHYGGLGTVFRTRAGRPISRQLMWTHWKNLTEAAGLGRDWQPRESRHTAVSLLSDAGQAIEDVSALAGHKNSHITRTVYRHLISAAPAGRTAATMDGIDLAASGETP